MKKYQSGSAVFAFGLFVAVAAQNITNIASPKGAYDFEPIGDMVWVATSGGLYNYSLSTGASTLRPASPEFPDPSIRALGRDNAGNLWAGSRGGYLLMHDGAGKESVCYSYMSAGWSVNEIAAAGSNLLIASDKGISLFDPGKRVVLKNATRIGTLSSSQIYTLYIDGRTLYVGGESGMAICKVPVDSLAYANFYDPSIWQVDSTVAGPVRSFLPMDSGLQAFKGPSANFNGHVLIADSTVIPLPTINPDNPLKFGSRVTAIKVQNGRCWIGTEEDYFDCWAEKYETHKIPGPTFMAVNRVFVDRDGTLWVLPFGSLNSTPWWLGINSFDGKNWKNFAPFYYPEMGHMTSGTTALGILQTQDNSMWFGLEGGQIKCYNPAAGGWFHYCNFGQTVDGNGTFVKARGPCPWPDWGKCDALAQDSAGYMWISSWNNPWGTLLCYKADPRESNDLTVDGARLYRRFPPIGISGRGVNISAIAVDRDQHIIYGMDKGELTIAEKVNNPLTDPVGLRIIKKFDDLQDVTVYKLVALGDGSTLVVTSGGVYRFDPAELTLSILDGFGKNVATLTPENDAIFWCGLKDEGVVVRYDALNNEKTTFTRANGLAADEINDLFIDKKRGNLWIATDKGISRLALGYTGASTSKKKVTVFPNPFSRNKHRVVYFRDVPPGGSVTVHALDGKHVGTAVLMLKGDGGAGYRWSPPSHLSPGTYFYAVVSPSMRTTGKIMLTP